MIKKAIRLLTENQNLSQDQCVRVAREIMSGKASDVQKAAFLTSLRMKGETSEEIAAFVKIMREFCNKIKPDVKGTLIDTCGTGGDKLKTFNISTAAAFVVAGAGIPVAKHGNRSVSSNCGSADILEAMGVKVNITPIQVQKTIEEIGMGFMFAPFFHPAMKHVQNVRRELGIRTIFNIIGPLTNPAGAKAQVIGVYSDSVAKTVANALKKFELKHVLVVNGSGMDEISTIGDTSIFELKNGVIKKYTINHKNYGIKTAKIRDLYVKDIGVSVEYFNKILDGRISPQLDIVLLNAAAGIMVGGKAQSLEDGLEIAQESVNSGNARKKFEQLKEVTQRYET